MLSVSLRSITFPHLHNLGWHSGYYREWTNIAIDNCTRCDDASVSNFNSVQYAAPASDPNVVPNFNSALYQALSRYRLVGVSEDMIGRDDYGMGGDSYIFACNEAAMPINYTIWIYGILPAEMNLPARAGFQDRAGLKHRSVPDPDLCGGIGNYDAHTIFNPHAIADEDFFCWTDYFHPVPDLQV